MTLADLETLAIERSAIRNETRHGYAFHETHQGRLRIKHDRGAESGRGLTFYFLNGFKIGRQRAADLLA